MEDLYSSELKIAFSILEAINCFLESKAKTSMHVLSAGPIYNISGFPKSGGFLVTMQTQCTYLLFSYAN